MKWLFSIFLSAYKSTSGTSQKFFSHLQPGCKAERFVYVLKIVENENPAQQLEYARLLRGEQARQDPASEYISTAV